MSSPITFSGFNNIDFNAVLNGLMQQASAPLTALQTRQKTLQTQITKFDALNTRVTALRSAADALGDTQSVSTLSGQSSDPSALRISAGTAAVPGHYDVIVTELARAQVTASTSTAQDADTTVVASGGTLTIGGVDVSLSGDTTLSQLAAAINNTDGIGVNAAVVKTAPDSYRLVLTSTSSGLSNAFTITTTLSGGTGVTFADTDNNGISGDSTADNAVAASDAAILFNNIAATSATNLFEDIVPGVSLTVLKKDPATTISLDVETDTEDLESKVEDFIAGYNALVTFTNEQRIAAGNGDAASIGHDPLLRQLKNSLRSELLGPHGSATVTRLAEIGVEFTQEGTLRLNPTLFRQAVTENGDDVRALLAGPDGVFPSVEGVLDTYTGAAGFVANIKERLTIQIGTMDQQIASMQARLAIQRAAMQREFTEADAAMSRLRNQSGSLANIGGGFGSF